MSPETLVRRCYELIGKDPEGLVSLDGDSLIGFFQSFRPDGLALQGLFDGLPMGAELQHRLDQLFISAGDDRRAEGGKDAYFVIRNPEPLDPDQANQLANQWLTGIHEFAMSLGEANITGSLDPRPTMRVLEGIPPKHPKNNLEKSRLLLAIQQNTATLVEQIDAGPLTALLRPAYYFTACDAMLRDYLMWPFYAEATGLADPLAAYFELWRHGVKYRIFGETQVDLYLPRQQG